LILLLLSLKRISILRGKVH